MPANQKIFNKSSFKTAVRTCKRAYSGRLDCLSDVGPRYEEALPRVCMACKELSAMMIMADSMITDIKENM